MDGLINSIFNLIYASLLHFVNKYYYVETTGLRKY